MFELLFAAQELPTIGADYGAPVEARAEQAIECPGARYAISFSQSDTGLIRLDDVAVDGRSLSPDDKRPLGDALARYRSLFTFGASCGRNREELRLIWSGFLERDLDEDRPDPERGVFIVFFIAKDGTIRIE